MINDGKVVLPAEPEAPGWRKSPRGFDCGTRRETPLEREALAWGTTSKPTCASRKGFDSASDYYCHGADSASVLGRGIVVGASARANTGRSRGLGGGRAHAPEALRDSRLVPRDPLSTNPNLPDDLDPGCSRQMFSAHPNLVASCFATSARLAVYAPNSRFR